MSDFKLPNAGAPQWYRTTPKADGITLVDEPWIKPFYRCNIWHVQGSKRGMVVDFGLGAVPLREQVALLSERDLLAVASHTHFDHIGAAHEFGCCHVHAAEADILTSPDNTRTLADQFLSDDMFEALPPEPYSHERYCIKAPQMVSPLNDGEILDLGNRHWEVIHTPGHSPGGIALWEAKTQTLISGDLIYDGPLIEDLWHSDLADYAASMRRLHQLPVRTVHGGHFPSFSGQHLSQLIDDWLRQHEL